VAPAGEDRILQCNANLRVHSWDVEANPNEKPEGLTHNQIACDHVSRRGQCADYKLPSLVKQAGDSKGMSVQECVGKALCLALLGVPFPSNCTINHDNAGWTLKSSYSLLSPIYTLFAKRMEDGEYELNFLWQCWITGTRQCAL
jgi:hypothetical protein